MCMGEKASMRVPEVGPSHKYVSGPKSRHASRVESKVSKGLNPVQVMSSLILLIDFLKCR